MSSASIFALPEPKARRLATDVWEVRSGSEQVRLRFSQTFEFPEELLDGDSSAVDDLAHVKHLAQTRLALDELEGAFRTNPPRAALFGGARDAEMAKMRERTKRITALMGSAQDASIRCEIKRGNGGDDARRYSAKECRGLARIRTKWSNSPVVSKIIEVLRCKDNENRVTEALTYVRMLDQTLAEDEATVRETRRKLHFDEYWNPQRSDSKIAYVGSKAWMVVGAAVSVYAHLHVVLGTALLFDQTSIFQGLAYIAQELTLTSKGNPWVVGGLQLLGLPYWGGVPSSPAASGPTQPSATAEPLDLPTWGESILPQSLVDFAPSWFSGFRRRQRVHEARMVAYRTLLWGDKPSTPLEVGDDAVRMGCDWLTLGTLRRILGMGTAERDTWLRENGRSTSDLLRVLGIVRWVDTTRTSPQDTEWAVNVRAFGDMLQSEFLPQGLMHVLDLLFQKAATLLSYQQTFPQIPSAQQFVRMSAFGLSMYAVLPYVHRVQGAIVQTAGDLGLTLFRHLLEFVHGILYR